VKKTLLAMALSFALAASVQAGPDPDHDPFYGFFPGTLVLTRTVYVGTPSLLVPGVTVLPPGCVAGTFLTFTVTCTTPTNDGTFPTVFNNTGADGHFGVTSPIFLDDLTTDGFRIGTLAIPSDQIVTSFSSKSELAVHLSTDGKSITFVGYHGGTGFMTGPNIFDVSNGNTPGLIDPTNAAVGQYYRSVAEVDPLGHLMITDGNAYSGDNGRGAIKADSLYYMVGNDNSGLLKAKQLTTTVVGKELVASTGAELLVPGQAPPVAPNITKIGDFEISQVTDPLTGNPYAADKPGKDNNYRGITIFNNTLYITKGSGGNGINTVYQVGAPGVLPTSTNLATLAAVPITILPGFPVTLAAGQDPTTLATTPVIYPFGIWFADANTLYVDDEGDNCTSNQVAPSPCTDILAAGTPEQIGASIYAHAANQTTAGLQKWILDPITSKWSLAYTIQKGLNLGVPQTIHGYPTGINSGTAGTNLPWAPATDGLRNLTGRVNWDGTVTLWVVTSTVSGSGDEGADPNQLVTVTDNLKATTPSTGDHDFYGWGSLNRFETIRSAKSGEVYRGVSFAPSFFQFY
jgi:hypothetical protein